jgi:methionine-rich copper-binding protein CopC
MRSLITRTRRSAARLGNPPPQSSCGSHKTWSRPAFSTLQVQDSQGKQVDNKDAHLDAQNKSLFIVTTPQLPPGTYTVTWQAVSVDTHKTQGKFKFTVK